jgi:FtsZ-binding cell division protein ZapB
MTNERIGLIAAAVIIIALLLLTFGGIKSKNRIKEDLVSEKSRSEALVTEKSQLEQEIAKFRQELADLQGKSDATDKLLEEANTKLAASQRRINNLSRQTNEAAESLRKELADVQALKADLEKKYSALNLNYDQLVAQNNDLKSSLEAAEAKLAKAIQENTLYDANNFQVSALKGKTGERLTAKGCMTKRLSITFDVPQSLTESVSFKVTTPDGTVAGPDDKALSWTFPTDMKELTASISPLSGVFESAKPVKLIYAPGKRLKKGEYKIEVLCSSSPLGNCRITLK